MTYDGQALSREPWPELPWPEIRGHGGILVRFCEPLSPLLKWEGDACVFELPQLSVCARASSLEEAERCAADSIAEDVERLTRTFPDLLTEEEEAQRHALLVHVDLLTGELGLNFPTERRLLGYVRGSSFVPLQADDFGPIPIPPALQRATSDDSLWLARVATYRDGSPMGEVLELISAPGEEA